MNNTIQPKRQAIEVFGGKKPLFDRIATAVRGTRIQKDWTEEKLIAVAKAGTVEDVVAIESKRALPTKDVFLAFLDALKLSLESVMALDRVAPELDQYWKSEMKRRKVGVLASANGKVPAKPISGDHCAWAFELFLRLEALTELCRPSPGPSPKMLKARESLAEAK